MSYFRINYSDFAPYKMERVAGTGIKKVVWDKITSEEEIENLIPYMTDERTRILIQKTTSMPFDVYIVPATQAWKWGEYIRRQSSMSLIRNCVYLLFGHDFIYAGKSTNGDRILGHIEDESKSGFDFQMLFIPNNDNPCTMTNWTSDFMSLLESLMIERIKENNPFCQNKIAGKDIIKSQHDLNLNADKEEFANNIIDLMFDAFNDLTYCSYLVPGRKATEYIADAEDSPSGEDGKDDTGMLKFWIDILNLCDHESTFRKLVKPRTGNSVYRNMNTDGLISNSSLCCVVTQSTCRVELVGWGDINSAEVNERNFDCLRQHKNEIEEELGCQLKWDRKDGKYTTSISLSKSLSYADRSNGTLRDLADFFSEYFDKFYSILPKYCKFEQDSSNRDEEFDINR